MKKRSVRLELQVHDFITPKIAITLTKRLNKQKRSLLVSANIAECNVSQHENKLS